jgi:hypothetical protein
MSVKKSLGKITKVTFGKGGYDDAMIGFGFHFDSSEGWSICDWWGNWADTQGKSDEWCAARNASLQNTFMRVIGIMQDAKVDNFNQLVGRPVELTVDEGLSGRLISWRILKEVL